MLVSTDALLGAGLTHALGRRGVAVLQASSGRRALALLETAPVSVLIVEARLPLMSGFDLAREVRAHGAALILITDVKWPGARKAAVVRQLGLLDLLHKPVDPEAVAAMAAQAIAQTPGRPCAVAASCEAAPGEQAADPPAEHSSTAASWDLRGNLVTTPLPQVLGLLYQRQATGALLLHGPQGKKIVYLRQGRAVYVKSTMVAECLGEVLVAEGVITAAQCQESLVRLQQTGKQQGAILLELGAITRRDLAVGLALQLKTKLLEIFGWTHGEFMFRSAQQVPTDEIRLDWSPAELIAAGVRRCWQVERLTAALAPLQDRTLRANPDPRLRFSELTLDPDERSLLDSVDGLTTLRELLARSPIHEHKALALIFFCLAAGVVLAEQPGDLLLDFTPEDG